ncbi:MAG: amino acid adenylation domain-containing protein, partial [Candidatus Methylumidiphilus sp.]
MNLNAETLTLPHYFHAVAEQYPARLALVAADRQLSYQELDRQSTRLARQLLSLGVESGQLIGLQCKLSVEAVIGVWGILKAGAVFVPLDPDYPSDRINYLLNDARLGLVLSRRADASKLFEHQAKVLYLDEMPLDGSSDNEPLADIKPEHLACCLYTSGSTGQPKGVMLEHQALVSHYFSLQQHYQLTEADRVLQFASFNHIAGVEQFVMALLSGATLVVPGQQLWTANEFLPKVKTYGLTLVDLPASYYQVLAREWASTQAGLEGSPIRLFIVGGEASSAEAGTLWGTLTAANIRFLNVYGMTEVSGTATLFDLPHDYSQQGNTLPIGRALPARTAQILDDDLQPVPDGETGEICLSGIGLARGYLNQPELTAEKFVYHPQTQERLYRTGDLGRLLPDGNLEYRGRLDHQVQIRGFRVELGEIEQTLLAHPNVEEAAVVAYGEGTEKQLVAYAVYQTKKNIRQIQRSYRHDLGTIADFTERLEFKLKQVNIQSYSGTEITLIKPVVDEVFVQNYLSRQSYRQFAQQTVPFASFCQFLSCLMQLNLPDTPIPKYRYPSAWGLYPVQTYLHIKPGRIEAIQAGFYYYHPKEHHLVLIAEHIDLTEYAYGGYNETITHQAAFTLFLVAELEAITPFYGQQLAEKFCLIEAGYIGQQLMIAAPTHELGLCPLGDLTEYEKTAQVRQLLGLTENQLLIHGFLGGAIEQSQTTTWLQETSHQQTPTELKAGLKTYLQEKLPAHMVPGQYVLCEQLPKTPNGKIDRKALPAPELQASTGFSQPATPTEELLAVCWANVLKREAVGRDDNFFELGGHSLLATQLVSRIRESFRVELPIRAIFEHPQLARLATAIDSANKTLVLPAIEVQAEGSAKVLSFAQQRLWFLNQLEGASTATYNLPEAFSLSGLLNIEALRQSLLWLMERHTSLRTCFPHQDGEA